MVLTRLYRYGNERKNAVVEATAILLKRLFATAKLVNNGGVTI